ncbi:MAG: hypothetical protein V1878_01485 [bacterium]|jgi:uncharacterized protein involved in outer membrane biogenesis
MNFTIGWVLGIIAILLAIIALIAWANDARSRRQKASAEKG